MHRSSKIYKDTDIVANPREVEANLLYHSASRLQAIQGHWEDKASGSGMLICTIAGSGRSF
jgi:hypothetical protein